MECFQKTFIEAVHPLKWDACVLVFQTNFILLDQISKGNIYVKFYEQYFSVCRKTVPTKKIL